MNRRRLLFGVGIALVVLIGIGVAGVIALPGIIRWAAVSQLGKATGRAVTLDAVEVSLYHGRLALRGLRVMDRDGGPLATLERAEIRWSPRDLLRLHTRIVDATLQSPTVRIVRTGPNEFNVSDLLGRRAAKGGEPPALTIERFALLGGSVVIEDRTLTPARTWRVEALDFRVRGASTVAGAPPGDATLSAVAAGAPIALAVTGVRLSPVSFKATLSAREIDASLAALYLPPRSPLSPSRGKLTFTATLEQTKDGSDVGLEAAFTSVELLRPGQETAYLTAPAVKVKVDGVRVRSGSIELGRLAVDGGAVILEDTRLKPVRRWQVDGIALEARNLSSARNAAPGVASVRAATSGARLEVWVSNARLAPLELDATAIIRNVDLSLVRLYLPPELPVQPERGIVNATVRVRHDGRGTRAGLDAGLSNIEVQRPGHFVTAPAVRVTVDDVTLGGGAVAVGRVSVTGDRLTLEDRATKRTRTWPVENLVVEAKDLSSRRDAVQGVASVRATVAGASASVFVTGARLQPLEGRATAILRNFDAALLKLYLPDEFPVQLGRGVVNATIEIGQLADATTLTADATLTGLEAQGRGAFATLGVKAPSVRVAIAEGRRQGPALSIGRVELTGHGSLVDSRGAAARFDFSQLRLTTESLTWPVSAPARVELSMRFQDRGELDGSGTARLTAPLPAVAWAADLALKFRRVDLAPLAVYVPAASGLGGRVRADVTASLAYAGSLTAHVKGDVGGARFALVDGDRTLLSLRSINATGLDLKWPSLLSIKQLRLREPYGLVVRDREGAIALAARFARREAPGAAVPAPGDQPRARPALPSIAIGEVVVENGSGAFVDEGATPAVRVDMPRLNLRLGNVTWPASAPVTVALDGTLPSGGSMRADGTLTAEPVSVDLTIACQEADLALLQPYLGFRARVGGRLDANLTVAGPLTPVPRVKIKGDVGLRGLDVSDGQRSVITADRLRVTGVDADWPERIAFDRVRARRAWALIQRDEHGAFLLRTLLERPDAGRPLRPAAPAPAAPLPAAPAPAAPAPAVPAPAVPAPAARRLEFSFREGIFDEQAATIIDARVSPPARIEVTGARLAVNDFSYPQKGPAKVAVKSPMPGGGQVEVTGSVQLEPMRLEARAVLDRVAIETAQPYLPIEGRVAGKVTGDLAVKVAMEPMAVQVTGQARLQAFRLNDGDRAVVTVGRVETSGIDVDWPRRIALQSVQFRRPRLLVERDAKGGIRLRQLVTPQWTAVAPANQPAAGSRQAPPAPRASAAPAPAIEIATFSLDKALARFVDYTTTPPYAEELEDLTVTFTPLATTPGRRTRFTAAGGIGGGAFKLQGEGAYGDRSALDMKLEIRDLVVPRANPYLDLYTAWAAQSGSLNVTGVYKLDGSQLETRHDLLVRGLEVARIDDRDEVERRVGLPFGMLVSLLKDARGEIKLSLPVSGDLSTREFDYKEAVWATIRNLSIRLIALPFSKIGSLFFSEDSKVTAVALAPVVFEPGTDRLGQGMDPHLEKVADFMRGAPAVKVVLEPILIEADVQALKRARVLLQLAAPTEPETIERAGREFRLRWPDKPLPPTLDAIVAALATAETLPPDAMRTLATRRIEAVRQSITRGGGVDAARLPGRARGTPLVEAAGNPRVELDLRS